MYTLYMLYVHTVQATCTDCTSRMYNFYMPRLFLETVVSYSSFNDKTSMKKVKD